MPLIKKRETDNLWTAYRIIFLTKLLSIKWCAVCAKPKEKSINDHRRSQYNYTGDIGEADEIIVMIKHYGFCTWGFC